MRWWPYVIADQSVQYVIADNRVVLCSCHALGPEKETERLGSRSKIGSLANSTVVVVTIVVVGGGLHFGVTRLKRPFD